MSYKDLLAQKLSELPKQIEILCNAYQLIADAQEREKKTIDLEKYQKRMEDGIAFLLSIDDAGVLASIERIRQPSPTLLYENKNRYLAALRDYRDTHNIVVGTTQIEDYIQVLKQVALIHTTKEPKLLKKRGLWPSKALWLTENKSCANAMDIALGLDGCVFFTHGFNLADFGESQITVANHLLDNDDVVVTSLDLFTFVLIKTGRTAPTAIPTHEWIVALSDYVQHMFAGKDFWQLKAEYILTFFASVDQFNTFAQKNFYSNQVSKAPEGEYPFLGEIKVFRSILATEIH
ncbi:hypothetical protein KA517_00835 [Candidatus Gracilibacteria bacterium]|nr:hypothetical protein [Candidatus Gracilibacteria bacterium]